MNTKSAEIEGAADRLRADMANRDTAMERLRTDMANRDGAAERLRTDMERLRTDMVKRDAVNTRWTIGAIAAAVVIILGGVRLIVGG